MAPPQLKTFFQNINTDGLGQIFLTGITDVKGYEKVNLEITQHPTNLPNLNVQVFMGKITGTTLSQVIDHFPLTAGGPVSIKTYSVVGPEVSVVITGGPPNTPIGIQAWVYLH